MRGKDRYPYVGVTVLVLLLLLLALLAPYPAESASSTILITAVYYDTYLTGEPEEAFRLMNVSESAVDLTGWTATDGEGTLTLQDTLPAGASVWIARQAFSFTEEFGFAPDYEYEADTDPAVPNLARSGAFELANTGDQVILRDDGATIVDSVAYEGGDPTGTGWIGPGIYPYGGDTVGIERFAQGDLGVEAFGLEGQILYRKLDQATGLPVSDTDTASDWAQATDDTINGKKVQYPGWDLKRYFRTETFTEPATLTYAVAPDNIYETLLAEINQASASIKIGESNRLSCTPAQARIPCNQGTGCSNGIHGAIIAFCLRLLCLY